MTAFYNEIDPVAAAWLRELIKQGEIADGVVDERSITDIAPGELAGFVQVHFFAGIGVWSYAARRAGWPDDRPLWSGSCPCQPYSSAGRGLGADDPRNLWWAMRWHIEQCKPPVVAGEQVAAKSIEPWIDALSSDLEALGYRVGAVPFPAAGVGAPHIRDRLYWMADTGRVLAPRTEPLRTQVPSVRAQAAVHDRGGRGLVGLAHADHEHERATGDGTRSGDAGRAGVHERMGDPGAPGLPPRERGGMEGSRGRGEGGAVEQPSRPPGGMGHPDVREQRTGGGAGGEEGEGRWPDAHGHGRNYRPGPVNGFWADPDWIFCRDGKWRPVEPGSSPLATGAPARVGRLRGYGNAINAEAARVFLESYLETEGN